MNNERKHNIPIDLLSRYFAQELTQEEKLELEHWRDAMEENKKEFDAFAKLWNITGDNYEREQIDINAEWKLLDKTISKQGKVISLKRVFQIAAAVVVLFGLTFLLLNQGSNISNKTQFAEVQTINLPDGSVVTLNSKSKIRYSKGFGSTDRAISLKGEAFFDVADNKALPFVIEAQGASIKVVGTQFNVKAYKNLAEVKVSVVEGVVAFFESETPKKQTTLIAGETGIYHKQEKTIAKHPKLDKNDVSWKTFEMTFDGTPLKAVTKLIQEVYHVEIEVSEKVEDCTLTVEFNQKDLTSVLKVLKSTLDLEIKRKGETIYIDGEGC